MPMMLRKKDFYAGLLMVLLGAGIGVNSATYSLGTFAHVGPGMFPLMLGLMMVLVGALIFVTGLATPLKEGERVLPAAMEWRGWACILAGPLMFVSSASISEWPRPPSCASSSPRSATGPPR